MPAGHFYSPIVDLEDLNARRSVVFDRQRIPAGIDLRHEHQLELLRTLMRDRQQLPFEDNPRTGCRYHFLNNAYSYGDAIVLARMVEHLRPRRVAEFGSGYSSCVILDVNEHLLDNSVQCTFIDPYPDLSLSLLKPGDRERISIVPSMAQQVPLDVTSTLEADDILFIDSTHVSKSGSDVHYHLFDVLPRLKPGVLVHFHDIFWPFEYPEQWFFEGNRSWYEVYLLRAFLMENADYQIESFNDYLANTAADVIREHAPQMLKNTGGSLWLRKVR